MTLNEVSGDSLRVNDSSWVRIDQIDTVEVITGSYSLGGAVVLGLAGGVIGNSMAPTYTGRETGPPLPIAALAGSLAGALLGGQIGSMIPVLESVPLTKMTQEQKLVTLRGLLGGIGEHTRQFPPDTVQLRSAMLNRVYESSEKTPILASALSLFVPTLGHSYAGNWSRGLPFLGGMLVGLKISVDGVNKRDRTMEAIGFMVVAGAKIWEMIDSYYEVERYNENLFNGLLRAQSNPGSAVPLKNDVGIQFGVLLQPSGVR